MIAPSVPFGIRFATKVVEFASNSYILPEYCSTEAPVLKDGADEYRIPRKILNSRLQNYTDMRDDEYPCPSKQIIDMICNKLGAKYE